ncbi:MAG: hypothetical protein Q8848_02525, partial [Candidatus Phytoplasma australasiaticum]|nr:hypothetical protein [Candidatus Phytoplasma australasiaticum]
LQVKLEDAVEADRIFTMLMGEEVSNRKIFIQENATYAEVQTTDQSTSRHWVPVDGGNCSRSIFQKVSKN